MLARTALIIGLLTITVAGCQRTGYVDPNKALNQTADGKALTAALNTFSAEKRTQVAAARAEVQKARDARKPDVEIAELQTKADQLKAQADAEFDRRRNAGAAKISDGLNRIIPKLRKDRGFTALQQTPIDVDPDLEVTAELAQRYDRGEGDPPPPPVASAEADKKIAALEKTVAAMTAAKPSSPSPPVASNAKTQGATQ